MAKGLSRWAAVILVVAGIVVPALAQEERGWEFSGRFSGSSNSEGTILKADPAVGYTFNRYIRTYAGLPFYFTKESSTTTLPTTGFVNGIGNAYVGVRLGIENPSVNYASNLVATAPTGDASKGFSTGRATVDWTNGFNHTFSTITPFANAGLANTVSDTQFFIRPFSSLGVVTHFDGGAKVELSPHINVGGSAYAIRAIGQQTIISKLAKKQTVGSAALADDEGISGWLSVIPQPGIDLQIGYTRSMGYDLNTLFFGVGFRSAR